MRILFITQYFYPEVFRGNDIAFDLAIDNEVTVVTSVPNYPQGSFFKGYGFFKKNREIINGVHVVRVPVFPRGKDNSLSLILNYFSYVFSASLSIVILALKERYDCVFVQQLSPVTLAIPGVIYKKLRKVPLYLWVLDLWPESLQSAGNINNKALLLFFEKIVRLIYKNSSKILISSKGFLYSILDKGVPERKIYYFPNWAEDVFVNVENKTEEIPDLLPGFRVMFAGNIGEAQDFHAIMNTAVFLKNKPEIKFIIIGDGRKKTWLDNFVRDNGLQDTVQLLGRYPLNMMPSFFDKANIMMVSLKDELIFNLTIPAKIQAYMASSKPILAMLNGEGAVLVKDAKCGYSVNAGDYKGLAEKIINMQKMDPDELESMGLNGRVYCDNNFNKQQCLINLRKILDIEK